MDLNVINLRIEFKNDDDLADILYQLAQDVANGDAGHDHNTGGDVFRPGAEADEIAGTWTVGE